MALESKASLKNKLEKRQRSEAKVSRALYTPCHLSGADGWLQDQQDQKALCTKRKEKALLL